MSKIEDYTARVAESLAAAEAATTEGDRQFHRRAHAVYRRLLADEGRYAQRRADEAALNAKAKPAKRAV
jgi:hypothetical protein